MRLLGKTLIFIWLGLFTALPTTAQTVYHRVMQQTGLDSVAHAYARNLREQMSNLLKPHPAAPRFMDSYGPDSLQAWMRSYLGRELTPAAAEQALARWPAGRLQHPPLSLLARLPYSFIEEPATPNPKEWKPGAYAKAVLKLDEQCYLSHMAEENTLKLFCIIHALQEMSQPVAERPTPNSIRNLASYAQPNIQKRARHYFRIELLELLRKTDKAQNQQALAYWQTPAGEQYAFLVHQALGYAMAQWEAAAYAALKAAEAE
jgi:hypothetical protein